MLPYENATSGKNAIDDIQRVLRGFGASSFGVMEDFAGGEVIVQFEWRDRKVCLRASAKGYAAAYLREHPYSSRMKRSKQQYEKAAFEQAKISVWSILRDWVKGQVTAVEVGMLSFEGAFLGQIMLPDGRTVLERVSAGNLLEQHGQE